MKKNLFLIGILVTLLLIGIIIAVVIGSRERFVRTGAEEEKYILQDIGLYNTENYRVLHNGKGKYKIHVQKNGEWIEWKGKTERMRMMEEMEKALNGIEPGAKPAEIKRGKVKGVIKWEENN